MKEEVEMEGECSSVPADDVDDSISCKTNDSREDLRFVSAKNCLRKARSGRKAAPGKQRKIAYQTSGRRLTTNSHGSNWIEETCGSESRLEMDRWSSGSECDSGYLQSNVDPSWSGNSRSDADLRRRTKFDWRAECSGNQLLCDEDSHQFLSQPQHADSRQEADTAVSSRLGEIDARSRCPFGFRCLSACTDEPKPDLRGTPPKYKYGGSHDFVCPSDADARKSRKRVAEGSCLEFSSPGRSFVPGCSEMSLHAGASSTIGASNSVVVAGSPSALRRRRSPRDPGAAARQVISTTDRPSEAFNAADAVDPSPDAADVRGSRHSSTRSVLSADVAASSPRVGSSRRSSVDRPAGSFNSADAADSRPLGILSHDLGSSSVDDDVPAGWNVDHVSPSSGASRCPFHFYADCAECPQCLGGYAVCGFCNTFHQPEEHRDVDDCLPKSGICSLGDLICGNLMADPVCNPDDPLVTAVEAGLSSDDRGGPMAALSERKMDLHSPVGRGTMSEESGRAFTRAPALPGSWNQSVRLRSLHFYTDCADCPDCCRSTAALCGSCCSVHGPPEEPADLSPRCAKRAPARRHDDAGYDPRRGPAGGGPAAAEPFTADDVGELERQTSAADKPTEHDDSAPRTSTDERIAIVGASPSTGGGAGTGSSGNVPGELDARMGGVDDGECWSTVEKATCGSLALLILVVFVAIYLQLTGRYFTTPAGVRRV